MIQVVSVITPFLKLPTAFGTGVTVLLLIGFPIACIFAWAFEITPDGIKRESDVVSDESIAAHTGRKIDFMIIGLMAIALGYFIYEIRFGSAPSEAVVATNALSEVETPKTEIEPEGSSIAVLPFINMSSDKEQEYFSDGISEEILNVLAKLPRLKVTSRSSAFSFKGKEIIVSDVAKQLGVKNILEGSVRKSGNRVRITAQLIEAESDTHLWSETYDRELTDIFVIQDEISAAIVAALKAKLGLDVKLATRDMSKVNIEAHEEYLKGRFYIENRKQADIEKALSHFDKAITLSPDYAAAWMGKAWASFSLRELAYGDIPWEQAEKMSRSAIEKALQLDPNLPETHAILALIESKSRNYDSAITHFKKAIALNPNYADAMTWYGGDLFDQPKKRLALYQKAVQLSPMLINSNSNYGFELVSIGRTSEAQSIFEHMLAINPSHHASYSLLAAIQLTNGKYADAILALETQIKRAPELLDARLDIAYLLSTLGLGEKAASYVEGTLADSLKHFFRGDLTLYVEAVREQFPRSDNDSLGYYIRAEAEVRDENYEEATKYFKLTNFGGTANQRIYSYQQTGDTVAASALLKKEKLILQTYVEVGAKHLYSAGLLQPLSIRVMELAFLEGDIEKAIVNLKIAMEKNYIVNFEYRIQPVYKKVRAHPDWPAIIARSDKHAEIQRDIYLKRVAERDNPTH